jgi:hypothetical protein
MHNILDDAAQSCNAEAWTLGREPDSSVSLRAFSRQIIFLGGKNA